MLTVKEVAELIKTKPSTIYAWAEQGAIPSFKIQGLLRFVEDDIIAWLDGLRRSGKCYNDSIQVRSSRKGGRR